MMKYKFLLTTMAILSILAIASPVSAEVPQTINYQGRLTDSLGNPVPDGNYQITFNIWNWDAGVQGEPPPNRYFDVKDPGKQKLWSKGREATTLLDQILLTMDDSFNAEEASHGAAIDIVQAVYPKDILAVTWGEINIGLHLF